MLRYSSALLLALSVAGGCRASSTTTPDDASAPVTPSDPGLGDPTDIEGEEIGDDVPDNASLVDQAPAEAAVNNGGGMDLK